MNHPMYSLEEKSMEASSPSSEKTKTKYYPSQTITSETLPELDNYDVGEEIDLHILGKIISKSERKVGEKTICEYRIESQKAGVMMMGKAKMKSEMGKEQYAKIKDMK